MALDTSVPWLNVQPKDFVAAASAGAEAGLGAARTMITARQVQQQASQEAARLSQQERIAQMEMQARQEIANQNHLVQQQQLAVQNAYHQAQIGVAKDRLAEVSAIAEQKARDAAMTFADEQGFYKAVSGGSPIPQALGQFPRTPPSNVNAIRMASGTPPGQATIVTHPETGPQKFLRQGRSGQETPLTDPGVMTTNQQMTKDITIQSKIDALERDRDKIGYLPKSQRPEALKKLEGRINFWRNMQGGKGSVFQWDRNLGKIVSVDLLNEPSHDEEQ